MTTVMEHVLFAIKKAPNFEGDTECFYAAEHSDSDWGKLENSQMFQTEQLAEEAIDNMLVFYKDDPAPSSLSIEKVKILLTMEILD